MTSTEPFLIAAQTPTRHVMAVAAHAPAAARAVLAKKAKRQDFGRLERVGQS